MLVRPAIYLPIAMLALSCSHSSGQQTSGTTPTTPTGTTLTGKVISVDRRPNLSEDGHYFITVANAALGRRYRIDATGYMNTPAPPSNFGQSCLPTPDVMANDTVEFELPQDGSGDFLICFKSADKRAYFLRVHR